MIWFNIKELERKIIENELSDEEGFKYFLALSILWVLGIYIGTSENFIIFIELLISVAITIWGSYSIFQANSSGDGQDFFKRYFALSWVIGFRLFIITLIIAIPLYTIYYGIIHYDSVDSYSSQSATLTEDFSSMIISSLINLIYYLLLTNSFKRVSMKKN